MSYCTVFPDGRRVRVGGVVPALPSILAHALEVGEGAPGWLRRCFPVFRQKVRLAGSV